MGLLGTGDEVPSRPTLSILSPEVFLTYLTVFLFEATLLRFFFPLSLSSIAGVLIGVSVALPLFPRLNFRMLPLDCPNLPVASLDDPFLKDFRDFPVLKDGATMFANELKATWANQYYRFGRCFTLTAYRMIYLGALND
jgi:hypothetical protein